MPKFKEGDMVVAIPITFHRNTKTHRLYSYTAGMVEVMRTQRQLMVRGLCDESIVNAGGWNWHPDDLEFFNLSLENK